ncbi:MAG: hypothetical protein ACOCXQ_02325 [Patescibacteria group bacterium]
MGGKERRSGRLGRNEDHPKPRSSDRQHRLEAHQDGSPALRLVDLLTAKEAEEVVLFAEELPAWSNMITNAEQSLHAQVQAHNARSKRLLEYAEDLFSDQNELRSTMYANAAFLKMYDELRVYGASEEEILEFYLLALERHYTLYGPIDTPRPGRREETVIMTKIDKAYSQHRSWFNGTQNDWIPFVFAHANLDWYLNAPDDADPLAGSSPQQLQNATYMVERRYLPEWVIEARKKSVFPDLSDVIDQFKQDKGEFLTMDARLDAVEHHADVMDRYMKQSEGRASAWLENQFSNYVMEMNISIYHFVVGLPYAHRFANGKEGETQKEYIEYFMKTYPLEPRLVGLLIDEEMRKYEKTGSANVMREALLRYIDQLFQDFPPTEALRSFETLDKQTNKFMRYQLAPVLDTFDDQTLNYIEEVLQNDSLQEVSIAIVDALKARDSELTDSDMRSLKQLIENVKKYGRKNLRQIGDSFTQDLTQLRHSRVTNPSSELPLPYAPSPEPSSAGWQQGREQDSQEEPTYRDTPLTDWVIAVCTHPDNPPVAEIEATSFSELQDLFAQVLRQNRIVCTVKQGSILSALEDIVGTPDEIEQMIPHLNNLYTENVVKKRKRGQMRILYERNDADRVLRVTLYKKDDNSYRKL